MPNPFALLFMGLLGMFGELVTEPRALLITSAELKIDQGVIDTWTDVNPDGFLALTIGYDSTYEDDVLGKEKIKKAKVAGAAEEEPVVGGRGFLSFDDEALKLPMLTTYLLKRTENNEVVYDHMISEEKFMAALKKPSVNIRFAGSAINSAVSKYIKFSLKKGGSAAWFFTDAVKIKPRTAPPTVPGQPPLPIAPETKEEKEKREKDEFMTATRSTLFEIGSLDYIRAKAASYRQVVDHLFPGAALFRAHFDATPLMVTIRKNVRKGDQAPLIPIQGYYFARHKSVGTKNGYFVTPNGVNLPVADLIPQPDGSLKFSLDAASFISHVVSERIKSKDKKFKFSCAIPESEEAQKKVACKRRFKEDGTPQDVLVGAFPATPAKFSNPPTDAENDALGSMSFTVYNEMEESLSDYWTVTVSRRPLPVEGTLVQNAVIQGKDKSWTKETESAGTAK